MTTKTVSGNSSYSADLTREPIPSLIRKITVPVSIGLFFNTMYNVTDTYFGGLISTQALAAMSLSLPVFFIIISIGSGMSTGTTALIGNALGAEDRPTAGRFAIQGLIFGIFMSVGLTGLGIAISPFLFTLLGASEAYLEICLAYMNILFKGTVFFIIMYMLNAVLNALGNTRTYRNFLIIGFLLNVLLDPWFIFGGYGMPPMGVHGIALATVLVQVIGCVYLGFHVHQTGLIVGISARSLAPDLSTFKEIARQGLPASLNIMTIALGVFVITYFISSFGQEAVAAYGIGMRVEQIVLLPAIGLNTTVLTLVANNYGARRYERVTETLNKALKYGGMMMAVGTLLVLGLADRLMGVFSDDPAVVEIGTAYLRVDALVFYAYVILFVSVAALQGIKKPMFAVVIGVFRQIIAPGAVFYLVVQVLDLGLTAIWWGILGVTWTAAIIAFFYSRWMIRKILPQPGGQQVTE